MRSPLALFLALQCSMGVFTLQEIPPREMNLGWEYQETQCSSLKEYIDKLWERAVEREALEKKQQVTNFQMQMESQKVLHQAQIDSLEKINELKIKLCEEQNNGIVKANNLRNELHQQKIQELLARIDAIANCSSPTQKKCNEGISIEQAAENFFEAPKRISKGELLISKDKVDFFTALKRCKTVGTELAVVLDENENNEVLSHISPYKESFWISGSDLGSEGSFYWMTTGLPMYYSYWINKNPDNYLGKEHCVHYWSITEPMRWNDNACETKMKFICMKNYKDQC